MNPVTIALFLVALVIIVLLYGRFSGRDKPHITFFKVTGVFAAICSVASVGIFGFGYFLGRKEYGMPLAVIFAFPVGLFILGGIIVLLGFRKKK